MCPMYRWLDEATGEEVEIIRPIPEYDVPPDEKEGRKWRKKIDAPKLTNPNKGNW